MPQRSFHTKSYRLLRDELIAARHTVGLTQIQLGKKLKRPQSFVAKYENGERRIDLIELIEIAAVIDLNLAALLNRLKESL